MSDRMYLTVLLGLLSLAYGLECPKQKTSPGREVICYTSVLDIEQLSNSICKCTTLVKKEYDLRNLSVSGFENFRKSLKEINPALQLTISVDDPEKTFGFNQQEAIDYLIKILQKVDAIELNMTTGSKERLSNFVKNLRDEMMKKSYNKRIFLVLPTKSEELAKQFDLKQLSKYVDLFTLPTHYLVEDDETYHTFHPSRLMGLFDMYNADSLIDLVSGLGVPKRKILVSVPASVHRFTLKDQNDNAPRALTEEMQPVVIDQKQLCDLISKDEWTIERDEDLTAPYAFKNRTWVAFEDKISIAIKGKYVLLRDLPGLAIRDIENDLETKCGEPLTHEIHHSFIQFKRKSRAAILNALEDDLHQTDLTYSTKAKSSTFRVVRVVDTEGHIRAIRENTQTEFTCSRQGYFVHPKSCNRFYRCVKFNQEVEDYSVFEFDCPAGLAFDEHTEVCVWPGSLSQGSPCPGSSEIAPVTRVRFECSKPGYYADPQNPRWFFACIDLGGPEMMAFEFRCPYGLIFDENKLICEWPWLVAGYSDGGYTRTEYSGEYDGQFTKNTGGYVTGGLPHAYSGTTARSGVYTGTTFGFGHTNTEFHRPAGVGYSGSNIEVAKGNTGSGSDIRANTEGYNALGATGIKLGTESISGHYGSSTGTGNTGYSGITTGIYAASGGIKYSGGTGAAQVPTGLSSPGTENTVHFGGDRNYGGTVGTVYAGSTHLGGQGLSSANGNLYPGSTFIGHGAGSGYSDSTSDTHIGSIGTGYTGSVAGKYAGPTSGAHAKSVGTGYIGSVTGGYAGSTSDTYGRTGYTDLVTGGYSGSAISAGSTRTSYTGSTIGLHAGTIANGIGYKGSATGDYSGSTDSTHPGFPTEGYAGSLNKGYPVYTGSSYAGSTKGYAGSLNKGYPVYTGSSYAGSTEGYAGSSGSQVEVTRTGPSITPGYSVGSNTLETKENYPGSSSVQYSGLSRGLTASGINYSGATVSGSSGHEYSTQTKLHTGSNQGNLHEIGQPDTVVTLPGQIPIYASSSPTDTQLTSVDVGHSSGSVYIQKPDKPNVRCTSSNCEGSTQLGDGVHTIGDYANQYSISSGSIFPTLHSQVGITTSGTSVYHDHSDQLNTSRGIGSTENLNTTLFGNTIPSTGTTYHDVNVPIHGITGTADINTIVTGNNIHGSPVTGDSSSGTIKAYGNTPGIVISGPIDQGTTVIGGSYPGYIKTGSSSPGYVIDGGIKTVYGASVAPTTVIYGPSSDGVTLTGLSQPKTIIKGTLTPGIVQTGQTAPGVSLTESIDQGTVVGSTRHHTLIGSVRYGDMEQQGGTSRNFTYDTKIGRLPGTYTTGYQTNEYHENVGRGTIKFNNGDVTTKYTENDIPDYRPDGGTIPLDIVISGSPTPSGFTKTGSTKTGFVTAALGGHGSYVVSTGKTYPRPNQSNIGEKAFEGNVAGYSKSSTESTLKAYPGATATPCDDVNHIDTSKVTSSASKFTGYAYSKPPGGNILTVTSPTPFLNVEVYKAPQIISSTPSSSIPHIYSGSVDGQYQSKIPGEFTRAPVSTIRPVTYTTGSLDNFKTAFEAAKVPTVISTPQSGIDTKYKTVTSPTSVPAFISHNTFNGDIQTGSVSAQTLSNFGTRTSQQDGYEQNYVYSTTPSSIFGVASTYAPIKPRPFSSSFPSVTEKPEVNYVPTQPSAFGHFDSTSKSLFGQRVTPSVISDTLKSQTQYLPSDSISPEIGVTYKKVFPLPDITYQTTPITPITSTSGSPTNVEISRDDVGKFVTNYNRGTTKYVPSEYDVYEPDLIVRGDFTREQSFSMSPYGKVYSSTTLNPFTKTQSQFYGYSKPSSVITYQTTAKSTAVGKAKVIVKWSDLHPLLLGKLGAECTCRGDPFANLRGPGSKLINSSKGKVDLSNYDQSDIYVDLEKDGSYEDDYVTNYESYSPEPVKTRNEASVPINIGVSQTPEKPSSTYLPNVTPDSTALRGGISEFSESNFRGSPKVGFSTNYRSGKSVNNAETPKNSDKNGGASFDRYGPGGLRDSEEILEGATNCARPGLFRHPNFCNKFYACHWDQWKKKFTLHVFNCPVHLSFDNDAGACNWPSMGPACQDDNLLV
ncbi:uncharacterized protein LOC143179660 [Calliopsis andreniformis]|uniref:uncharacterized protein LOC143179660 n=1 Tax=Calliopsis andreniformis TaxID=337506 RepID=UPI003FCCE9B0